jgi:hypothetical protein
MLVTRHSSYCQGRILALVKNLTGQDTISVIVSKIASTVIVDLEVLTQSFSAPFIVMLYLVR